MFKVRPLRSTGITPLPHYYGPLRLPIQPAEGYLFPPTVGDLPPPYRVSQVPQHIFPRALSPITPECPAGACVCCFPTGNRLHPIRKVGHTQWRNEAVTGSLALGLTRSWSGGTIPFAFTQNLKTDPLLTIGYPHARGRHYIANKQLLWLTPFSQQDVPDLSWRTGFSQIHADTDYLVLKSAIADKELL